MQSLVQFYPYWAIESFKVPGIQFMTFTCSLSTITEEVVQRSLDVLSILKDQTDSANDLVKGLLLSDLTGGIPAILFSLANQSHSILHVLKLANESIIKRTTLIIVFESYTHY